MLRQCECRIVHEILEPSFVRRSKSSTSPTDVAGALVDGLTIEQATKKRADISRFLNNNDSYSFFKKVGGHIITGPTRTNVNDIYLVLVL